jgi:hypothetical protein
MEGQADLLPHPRLMLFAALPALHPDRRVGNEVENSSAIAQDGCRARRGDRTG